MIRTWNTSGDPDAYYKLYSSSAMVLASDAAKNFTLAAETPPADWATQTARYVDLNAPTLVPDTTGAVVVNGTNYSARYPIMDPSAASDPGATGLVEGFELTNAPGYTGSYPPAATYNPAASPNPAPMPVEWLYVLADGTITTPTGVSGGDITAFSVAPTTANPLASRIAFWTDDETAKVNINTASEGSFWEIPRASSNDEWGLARNVPVQNEFQRVPGHVSGISLSPVLKSLLPRDNAAALNNTDWTMADTSAANPGYSELTPYYALTPRISNETFDINGEPSGDESSRGGTRRTVNTRSGPQPDRSRPMLLDASRLYASVDELFYSDTYLTGAGGVMERTANNLGGAGAAAVARDVSRFRFFLTTSGRAEETTPFGTPKVATWPLPLDTDWRNAKDRLIAKAASIGDEAYYFQRKTYAGDNPGSPNLLSSASKTLDYSDVERNQELYKYLQKLTNANASGYGPIPGYGSNFSAKWSALGRDRVLTQVFDVIRGLTNIHKFRDDYLKTLLDSTNTTEFAFSWAGADGAFHGTKYVVPIEIDEGNGITRGFGRFATVSEMSLLFNCYTKALDPGKKFMRVIALFQPYSPTPGHSFHVGQRIRVRGLEALRIGDSGGGNIPLGFPATATVRYQGQVRNSMGGTDNASAFKLYYAMLYYAPGPNDKDSKSDPRTLGVANEDTQYPFASAEIDVTGWTGIRLTGAPVEIGILDGASASAASAVELQKIAMNVPDIGITTSVAVPDSSTSFESRIAARETSDLITEADITRSVVFRGDAAAPHRGDYRLLALARDVPATWFAPHPNYPDAVSAGDQAGRFAHSLRRPPTGANNRWDAVGQGLPGEEAFNRKLSSANTVGVEGGQAAKPGGLVSNIRHSQHSQALTPIGLKQASAPTGGIGDFASGFGFRSDGALVTPVDFSSSNGAWAGYFSFGEYGDDNASIFEPTRILPSAAAYGDLITPDATGTLQGWQTLLFNPVPAQDNSPPIRTTERRIRPTTC
jgi:uncharacterized protein (TIGR02600 family)